MSSVYARTVLCPLSTHIPHPEEENLRRRTSRQPMFTSARSSWYTIRIASWPDSYSALQRRTRFDRQLALQNSGSSKLRIRFRIHETSLIISLKLNLTKSTSHRKNKKKNIMESLLSLSFDYLSSYDAVKIRKGLRQLEGLLAQICLSRSAAAVDRRQSVIGGLSRGSGGGGVAGGVKDLAALGEDKAFREFFRLQEGFEWNGKIMGERENTAPFSPPYPFAIRSKKKGSPKLTTHDTQQWQCA